MAKGRPKGGKKIGGRSKGTVNKKTIESIKRVEFVLNLLEGSLDEDIAALDPKDRVKLWNDLQEYIRPKLARTEVTGKDGKDFIQPVTTIEIVHTNQIGTKDTGQQGT